MTDTTPYLGQHVLYTLSAYHAEAINKRRADFEKRRRTAGDALDTGHVGHTGNPAEEGQVCAATVVRVFHPSTTTVNLQVHLDGNDTLWATSAPHGEGPGHWS